MPARRRRYVTRLKRRRRGERARSAGVSPAGTGVAAWVWLANNGGMTLELYVAFVVTAPMLIAAGAGLAAARGGR